MSVHILVMNDTQEIQQLFKDLLSLEGYQVTAMSYSPNELEIVLQIRPDLIIADFPPLQREEQGWQLVQKLRMLPATANIPIIVCTTNMRAIRNTEGWLAAKGIAVVPKPFNVEELLQVIKLQLGTTTTLQHDAPPQTPTLPRREAALSSDAQQNRRKDQ